MEKTADPLKNIVSLSARMYPREIFHDQIVGPSGKWTTIDRTLEILQKPGVYVLYRDDKPYYVGKAKKLRVRLYKHARVPGSKYDLFWNYFSAFVVDDPQHRNSIEALLIAAMPTANGARPKLETYPYHPDVKKVMMHKRKGVRFKS